MGDHRSSDLLLAQYVKIASVVTLYWLVSISMVFANKALLSDQGLAAPLFVTGYQCVVTVLLSAVASAAAPLLPSQVAAPRAPIRLHTQLKVLPLTLVFVGMISFNNLCLQYVNVSFYYVGRSLTTVFNVVCSYILLGQGTSWQSLVCCGVIVFGFLLGVDQEGVAGSLSVPGVVFGVLASLFVSLFAIYTKKVLPAVDNNVFRLAYYNNVNACVLFAALVAVTGEWTEVARFPGLALPRFWLLMTAAGVFGYAIGYVTGLQIQVTSPLTHNISGTAKACAQTVLGSWWYAESRPLLWWLSNGVVLMGSGGYTRVRQLEMEARHAAAPPRY